jgi:phenylacetic acid degradation operon negative regulatory protein
MRSRRAGQPDADRAVRAHLGRALAEGPVRAGAFIVTLYGDVVVPWGGVAWMGNVIETCADLGINESLARTAVSRLVASGVLEGERLGRRSYYRLTEPAGADFAAAAEVLFAPADPADADWLIVCLGEAEVPAMEALERRGFGRLAPRVAIAPLRGDPADAAVGVVFRAALASEAGLRELAASWWRLEEHARAYAGFVARFAPLEAMLDRGEPSEATCLAARLLLVHEYRAAALADPRLPSSALPRDWPGGPARRLFARLYLRLAPPADSHVARHFRDAAGPLRQQSATMARRLATLSGEHGRASA